MASKTEVLKTILDTRDVIISGVVNDLFSEGFKKEDIKKVKNSVTKTVYAQFDSLLNRVEKTMD
tara:strand:- start:181 stop:372 length:192 start_codon:yes stop_codon:yes gene_type:complete